MQDAKHNGWLNAETHQIALEVFEGWVPTCEDDKWTGESVRAYVQEMNTGLDALSLNYSQDLLDRVAWQQLASVLNRKFPFKANQEMING